MKKIISIIISVSALFTIILSLPANAAKNMGYAYPVPGVAVFQAYKGSSHAGVDISTTRGTAIYATKSGTIIAKYEGCYNDNGLNSNVGSCSTRKICKPTFNTKNGFCNDGFGNGFIIKHDDDTWSSYAHMRNLASGLEEGSYVNQGDYLGEMGSSGRSTGSHLHFEIRTATKGSTINEYWNVASHVNPMNYMDIDDRGQSVSDGMYTITTSINTKYALSIADASTNGKANVRIETNGNKKSQKFNIRHITGGYYTITNINSGKVLDAENGGTASGTNVWQYTLNNTDAQLWKIEFNSDKSYTFVNKKSGHCLDVSGGEAKNKQNVQIYKNNGSAAQKWYINKAEDTCMHLSYTAYGYCKSCGVEYPSLTIGGTFSAKIKKDKVPVRLRPYSAEKTLYTLNKGASVTLVGFAFNSYHNVWYKTNDGKWIYSENIDLPTVNNLNMSNIKFDINGGKPRISMICSYSGARPSEVGAYVGTTKSNMQKYASDAINFSKNPFEAWYDIEGFKAGSPYYYQFYAIVNGIVKVSEIKTFMTENSKINDPISELGVNVNISPVTKITTSTARVNGGCSYTGTRPTEVGIKIGYAENALVKVASDTINFSKNPFDIWYDLNGLKEGTKYYYVLYALVNGAEIISDTGTFTTAKGTTSAAVSALPQENLKLNINAVSKLTTTTARVNASCSYTGTRPTEVGLYIGTDAANLKKHSSDVINFSKNPFDIWYDLTGLKAGATYYYKVYAIVNGKTIWSAQSNFTTAKGTTSAALNVLPANTRIGIVTGTNGDNLAINDKAAASPKYSNEIGVIPPGAQMTVYPDKAVGNWYYVTYNGISGYAYGKYITFK